MWQVIKLELFVKFSRKKLRKIAYHLLSNYKYFDFHTLIFSCHQQILLKLVQTQFPILLLNDKDSESVNFWKKKPASSFWKRKISLLSIA